jgi:hypothetical protein
VVARRSSGSRPQAPSQAATPPQVVVPKLNTDPIWSLQPWPIEVLLGGQEYTIPALAAVEWLAYLMQPQPDLDGLILDFFPDSEELLFSDRLNVDELYDTILDLIATVCARSWWVALRQISIARASWHILGPMMLEAVDAREVSIAAWLDVLLIKMLNSMDPKDATLFTSRLEAPPIGEVTEPMEEMEMDRGAFLSLQ